MPMQGSNRSVLLVLPPHVGLEMPNLGVSVLKSLLKTRGFDCEVLYLNIMLAERLDPLFFRLMLAQANQMNLAEFLFSDLLYKKSKQEIRSYAEEIVEQTDLWPVIHRMLGSVSAAELLEWYMGELQAFSADAMNAVVARNPWLVGIANTFVQPPAMFFSQAIREALPAAILVMGGGACAAEMGHALMERLPALDYVVQGEADLSFPTLVEMLSSDSPPRPIPGVLCRDDQYTSTEPAPLVGRAELDAQPYPDFDDYFSQLSCSSIGHRVAPVLPLEGSRGCWWGDKHRCSFCGFGGEGLPEDMLYRSKSPERVLQEITDQSARYGVNKLFTTDSILDLGYFKTLYPQLAKKQPAVLFWETKANLTKQQVETLARARVNIGPGIESFSDKTLALLNKGATAVQNIQTLKWSGNGGLFTFWLYLGPVPHEQEQDVQAAIDLFPSLHHMRPPIMNCPVEVHRFAPYHAHQDEHQIGNLEVEPSTRASFALSPAETERLSYRFRSELIDNMKKRPVYERLRKAVAEWNNAHWNAHLVAIPRKHGLYLLDTRRCATSRIHRLTGNERQIYEICDRGRRRQDIARVMRNRLTDVSLSDVLASLLERRLMIYVSGRYLSLAHDASGRYSKMLSEEELGFIGHLRPPRLAELLGGRFLTHEGIHAKMIGRAMRMVFWGTCEKVRNDLKLARSRLMTASIRRTARVFSRPFCESGSSKRQQPKLT